MQVRRRVFGEETVVGVDVRPFARASDHAACRHIHRRFGTTYYVAARCLQSVPRRRTHAVYAFVRVPDEWVDNPGDLSATRQRELLNDWRLQLVHGLDGVRPEHPVMRAFCDVCREVRMPVEEPLTFLDAMESDLTVCRYETYDELRRYMRGSAASVGLMMSYVLGASPTVETVAAAKALGEAMQLTNFLRDVGEDAARGRLYLPQEDLRAFGVSEEEIFGRKATPEFVRLLRFEIERTRALYSLSDPGIESLPGRAKVAVRLARALYSKILDKIEEQDYDVFQRRAATTRSEKLHALGRALIGGVRRSN